MASVHIDPRKKRPVYYAYFMDGTGKRFCRSTGTTDKKKAQAAAERFEIAARKAAEGVLVEAAARRVLSDILESTGLGRIDTDTDTVKGYLEKFIEEKRPTVSPKTLALYVQVIEAFLGSVKSIANRPLAAVTPGHVSSYLSAQSKGGRSNSTVNHHLKVLRAAFGKAHREGVVLTNPADAVNMLPADGEEREVFSPGQIKALLAEADLEWRGLILIGYYVGGMRLGDAAKLTWEHVDAERGTVRFRPAKSRGRKEVEVPMHPRLKAYLFEEVAAGDDPTGPLFPDLSTRALGGNGGLSVRFQRLMRRAGVEQIKGAEKEGAGRQFNKLTFHSLRHSAISHMANAGVPPERREKLSGHSSAAVHKRYTHHELETLAGEVEKLPTL